MGGCSQGGSSETMGAEELNEPLAAADVEQGRARAVSDITMPGQVDPDKVKNAVFWTVLGFMFSNGVGLSFSFIHPRKHDAMMEFYAGYILELSLSLDNLFAFYLVFKYFKVVSEKAQNRVLFWGIVGAIVLRAAMVLAGAAAIHEYRPLLLVCAAVLIYSTYQVFFMEEDDEDEDLSENSVVKLAQYLVPCGSTYHSSDFVHDGKFTPLMLVLVVIEFSDVVFAVDSVPAIFGITENTIVVWAACMCAILCLRSLYTLVVQFVTDLPYMNNAIGIVLFFIALKLISDVCFGFKWPIGISLGIVAGILGVGAVLSIQKKASDLAAEEAEENA